MNFNMRAREDGRLLSATPLRSIPAASAGATRQAGGAWRARAKQPVWCPPHRGQDRSWGQGETAFCPVRTHACVSVLCVVGCGAPCPPFPAQVVTTKKVCRHFPLGVKSPPVENDWVKGVKTFGVKNSFYLRCPNM
uniref:Uncharacterized protein n=1 Tax=Rousettus aegyptiacus TaxID=9407 RepID=A0A7J8B975_ROUAE|nr:hypothetical protein HJG63_009950 [Rousettus aegyptiacus]